MPTRDTIDALLKDHAQRQGQSVAISDVDSVAMPYSDLDITTDRIADVLAEASVRRSDRVAIVLPNGPMMAVSFLATAKVAVAAPLNPHFREPEFRYYLDDLGASAVIVADEDNTKCAPAAAELGIPIIAVGRAGGTSLEYRVTSDVSAPAGERTQTTPDDVALILHTSGTTSRPKMVPLTHRNLCASASNVAGALGLSADDVCLNIMPLFHIHGLVAALLSSLWAGAEVVCSPGFFAPDFLNWCSARRPTWYTGVPTMHQSILERAVNDEAALSKCRFRFIRSSSASLPPSVFESLASTFGVPIIEAME